jgi:hypothetical protein
MGWVVSVTPRLRFSPGERTPGTHCTGGWVGLTAGRDTETRGEMFCLCQGSNPGLPVRSHTLYWLSCPRWSEIIAPCIYNTAKGDSRSGRFMPRKESPWYPLHRRLDWSQNRSKHGAEEKSTPPPEIKPLSSSPQSVTLTSESFH